jgi:hypothetical protein
VIVIASADGPVGTISLTGGKLKGSTKMLQQMADQKEASAGSPAKAFRELASLNNGYIWASESDKPNGGQDGT